MVLSIVNQRDNKYFTILIKIKLYIFSDSSSFYRTLSCVHHVCRCKVFKQK